MSRVLIVTLLSLVSGIRVWACSCVSPDFPDAVREASAIYRGTVLKSEPAGEGLRTVTFRIDRTWKGKASASITATHVPSTCETGFKVGGDYLVLETDSKPITVDICSNTKLAAEASRELVYLDKKFSATKKKAATGKAKKK